MKSTTFFSTFLPSLPPSLLPYLQGPIELPGRGADVHGRAIGVEHHLTEGGREGGRGGGRVRLDGKIDQSKLLIKNYLQQIL
jgi:hypothetical protein